MKRSHVFALMVGISLALMLAADLPLVWLVGRVLLLFSTLFHELGHGLTAILVGGHLDKVTIAWDASGATLSRIPDSAWRAALIAAGGLIGPAAAAAALFWSARGSERRLRASTLGLGLALLLVGVLAARSFWAVAFTVGLGALLLYGARRQKRSHLEAGIVFIAVQLGLSVFTRADYLFTQSAGEGRLSDVQQMAEQLWLPYWFWGILCGAVSLAVLFWGFRCYTRD